MRGNLRHYIKNNIDFMTFITNKSLILAIKGMKNNFIMGHKRRDK